LLLVPSLRTHAPPGRQAAGRATVAKAGTVVVRAPEPGRLKRGDRCVLQSRLWVAGQSRARLAMVREDFADPTSARLLRAPDPRGCQALPD